MHDRDSILPLAFGVVFALSVHLAGAAGYVSLRDGEEEPKKVEDREEVTRPAPPAAPQPAVPLLPDKPDLAVERIAIPAPRTTGEPTKLTAQITNHGSTLDAPFDVVVQLDGKPIARSTVTGSLSTGGVFELHETLNVETPGPHEVAVIADVDRAADESDETNNELRATFAWKGPKEKIPLGQNEPSDVKINWISAKAFEDLLARKAPFDQAAVQNQVDPTPAARIPLDPTKPAPRVTNPAEPRPPVAQAQPTPQSQPAPRATKPSEPTEAIPAEPPPPTPEPMETKEPPSPMPTAQPMPREGEGEAQAAQSRPSAKVPVKPGEKPALPKAAPNDPADKAVNRPKPVDAPTQGPTDEEAKKVKATEPSKNPRTVASAAPPPKPRAKKPAEPRETPTPQPQTPPQPQQKPQPQTTPNTSDPRPTSALKDDREAFPVSRAEKLTIRPGTVLTRQGLVVNTVNPRYSVQSSRNLPDNPDVRVVFDPTTGKATHASIIKSSGYDNLDGPILISLYKWTIAGDSLKKLTDPVTLDFHFILRDEKE